MSIPTGVGICIPWQSEPILSATRVRLNLLPKWWYNYLSNHVGEHGYVPMLWRPTPGDAQWNAAVQDAKTTGRFYLLFNEPEYSGQSNTPAALAAEICNQWQHATRRKINGKWTVTPWGGLGLLVNDAGIDRSLEYATDYLDAGGRVPPVWHIHIYAHSGNHWETLWDRWSSWIHANKSRYPGLQKPVIVTEFASWDASPAKQIEVLHRANFVMQDRAMLHGIAWFSSLYGFQQASWKKSDAFHYQTTVTAEGTQHTSNAALTEVGKELKKINIPTSLFPSASNSEDISDLTHGGDE